MTGPTIDLGTPHLLFERRGPVGWCRVDRPDAKNLLTPTMYDGIGRAVTLTAEDPHLHALVLTGTGGIFVPGGEMGDDPGESRRPSEYLPFRRLLESEVPVIAAVNGLCQASGLLMTLLADISVASDRARFRAPELLRGLPDPWLAALLPAHVGLGRAREIALSGRWVGAEEALQIGLVGRVVPDDQLDAAAEAAAHDVLDAGPGARRAWRDRADMAYGPIDESALDRAPDDPEVAEGFAAFLERRPPAWGVRPA